MTLRLVETTALFFDKTPIGMIMSRSRLDGMRASSSNFDSRYHIGISLKYHHTHNSCNKLTCCHSSIVASKSYVSLLRNSKYTEGAFPNQLPSSAPFILQVKENLRGADIMQHVNSDFEPTCLILGVELLKWLYVRILLLTDRFVFFTSLYFVYISGEGEASVGMGSFEVDYLSTISYNFQSLFAINLKLRIVCWEML
uniref:Uncharacterized protein n=1 Tax=Candidozyma auris TaxID=498019 RepID=A0A0L0NXN0_CANAR